MKIQYQIALEQFSHRIIQLTIHLFIAITHSINHLQRRMLRIIQSKNTEIYDDV